jgi:tetratricopeptide (TPR) repeat protein
MSIEATNRPFDDRSRWLVGLLVSGVVLLVAAALAAKPTWRALRTKRVERFIAQAIAAREAKDTDVFIANLRAANEIDSNNPRVLRLNAEHYARYGNPDGLTYWHLLQQSGQATRDDLLGYARLALACDRADLARAILKPLHYGDPNDAQVLVVLSELFEREGDLPQATSAALDAITRNPGDSEAELRLARLELASGNAVQRKAARSRLYGLLSGTSSVRAEAAMTLVVDGQPTPADLALVSRMLSQQTNQTFSDRLARLLVDLRRGPDSLQQSLANFKAGNGGDFSLQERGVSAERLGAMGEFKAVLEIVPESVALTNKNLAVLRLGALAFLRDLTGVENLLKHPDQSLPPAFTATFRATVATLANRTNEAPLLWKSALAESAEKPMALRTLALQAERAEAYEVAVQCWQDLMGNPAVAPFAARQLLRIAKKANDPRTAFLALRRLVGLDPNRSDLRLPLAYYQALLELEPADTERFLSTTTPAPEDRELFAVVSALFELRRKQPDKAAELLEGGAIDWTNAPASWVAVRVAALGNSGNRNQALEVAARLNRDRLSAQEFALVEPWLPKKPSRETNP